MTAADPPLLRKVTPVNVTTASPDTLDLATLAVFLRRGRHPSLPLLLLGIAPVSTIREPRSVGYSYMSRWGIAPTCQGIVMISYLCPVDGASIGYLHASHKM